MNVSVHEAKTHLSRLIAQVEAGEDVVINRNGTPVVRLVPVVAGEQVSLLGAMRGKLDYSGFDEPLPDEILDAFGGLDS